MITNNNPLIHKKAQHQTQALSEEQILTYLKQLNAWEWLKNELNGRIRKVFQFENYYQTLAFVNAVVPIFHSDDHHPELKITYNQCTILLDTHSVIDANGKKGGLSENDFIVAAKIDAIHQLIS